MAIIVRIKGGKAEVQGDGTVKGCELADAIERAIGVVTKISHGDTERPIDNKVRTQG